MENICLAFQLEKLKILMDQSKYNFIHIYVQFTYNQVDSAGTVLNTGSTTTDPPSEWRTGTPVGINEGTCSRSYEKKTNKSPFFDNLLVFHSDPAIDGIMATFAMKQPSNMGGWSVKVRLYFLYSILLITKFLFRWFMLMTKVAQVLLSVRLIIVNQALVTF